LGIAACCLKAGNMEKAELAYNRTLQLLPNCTAALLGLAVLKLHVSSKEQVRHQPHSAMRDVASARVRR
jgi:RNA polymerase-associated protein CTR9